MALHYDDLGVHPVALQVGPLALTWYSLAYLAGVLIGWFYLLRLLERPGAPMARRHAEDFITYAIVGVILGGRLGYVLFYNFERYVNDPIAALRLWEGGMSFHGGVIGTSLAIVIFSRRHKLDWLRVHDYIACVAPIGLGLGRLANFVNAELWGATTSVPWGIIFPTGGPEPRHPSQLYEALLEGLVLFFILRWIFLRTQARYQPGKLVGVFLAGYGSFRFLVEFVREPDAHLVAFAEASGLHMGQWLSLPMIFGGAYLIVTARRRQFSTPTPASGPIEVGRPEGP